MATANTQKPSADKAAGKKPRAAGEKRAAKARAAAAAPPLEAASSTPRAAAPKARATRAAKGGVKHAAKVKKTAPAKKLDSVKKPAAKKPAAKKPAARKRGIAGEAAVARKPAASKAPTASTAAWRGVKSRIASKPQAPAVLSVASMRLDTSLAAQVAARAVLGQARKQAAPRNGPPLPLAANAPASRRQSTLLRELRETVTNPASHQLDNLFSGAPPQGQGQPFRRQPFGRRQAAERRFEPHAGHYGVPRRAAG